MNDRERLMSILNLNYNGECVTLTEDTRIKEALSLDSMDMAEMQMELESEFGVEIPDEQWEKVVTIADCVKLL